MRFAVSSPRVMTLRMTHMRILLNSAADVEQGQLRCLAGFIHLQLEVRHAYEFPQRILPEPARCCKPVQKRSSRLDLAR